MALDFSLTVWHLASVELMAWHLVLYNLVTWLFKLGDAMCSSQQKIMQTWNISWDWIKPSPSIKTIQANLNHSRYHRHHHRLKFYKLGHSTPLCFLLISLKLKSKNTDWDLVIPALFLFCVRMHHCPLWMLDRYFLYANSWYRNEGRGQRLCQECGASATTRYASLLQYTATWLHK